MILWVGNSLSLTCCYYQTTQYLETRKHSFDPCACLGPTPLEIPVDEFILSQKKTLLHLSSCRISNSLRKVWKNSWTEWKFEIWPFLLAQKINRLIKACTHSDNVCSSLQAQISARQVFQFSYNGICRVFNYFVSHSQQEYHIFRDSDILGTFE